MSEMRFYIDKEGAYLGGWDASPPEDSIEVEFPPENADQPWLFPGWGSSPARLSTIEGEWRDSEMPIAQQNVTAFEYGEKDIPGTVEQWKAYWLALRKWTVDNPDFPNSEQRPVRPS